MQFEAKEKENKKKKKNATKYPQRLFAQRCYV